MTSDIFGRRALEFGGAFAADSAHIGLSLSCEGVEDSGLLTQVLSVQYSQPITRLYEVGSQKTYYVAGRPQGTANIGRILGPGAVMASLYSCLGDVCNAATNDLCFCVQSDCLGNQEQEFGALAVGLKNVVLQSLGFSIQAQDMVVNEQMSLFFTSLIAQSENIVCAGDGAQDVEPSCFSDYYDV